MTEHPSDLEEKIAVLKKHICCHSDAEVDEILDEVRREAVEKAKEKT